jgi:UDP-2-acetamido-3-amino-2,3-dideoxy-glucuronate N-acetyltransferase
LKDVHVHPTAVVDKTAKIGKGTKIWHFAHVREAVEIGENCVLGHAVYVDKRVKIGNRVKLENKANVYQGVEIEDDVFVGPDVTFTNDLYPRSFNTSWKASPTLVKQGASIGAGTVVICGTTIGEYSMIGAGSVVTNDIPSHTLAYGNPAKIMGMICKCGRKLVRDEKQKEFVLMRCPLCGEKVKVPLVEFGEILRK